MIDETHPRGRIVGAALSLATEKPWRDVTLREIGERAGLGLKGLREHVQSKGDVLALLARAVDDEVLAKVPPPAPEDGKRDRLFEVLMARLDVLAPYKAAVRSIVADASTEPAAIRAMFASQGWMLQAAGIDSGGIEGRLKVAGLTSVYASVLRTWLDDEDPGLARTMAALDRRLRRGERKLTAVGDAGRTMRRIGEGLASVLSGSRARAANAGEAGAARAAPAHTPPHAPNPAPTPPQSGTPQPGPS